MQVISLQPIPNQSFNIQLDNVLYQISVKTGGSFMFVDIIQNGTPLVLGMRAVAGTFLIPYEYLATLGNFLIITANEEYPYYTEFGIDQFLIYFSQSDLENLRV
jgi:hypothetical protein